MRLWQKRWFRIGAGVVVSAAALWLSFRRLDWRLLYSSFARVRLFWVFLGVANILLTLYALGWRWQILLRSKARVSMVRLFRLNIISQYTNIIAPARLGEAARAYLVSKEEGVPAGFALGTVAIEKILDFFLFAVFWIAVPSIFALQTEFKGQETALFFCGLAFFFLAAFIWKPGFFLGGVKKLLRFIPASFREKIQGFMESGAESFQQLRPSGTLVWLVILTAAFVGGQALTNFFLFRALGLRLPFWAAIVVLLAVQVGNIPPSVPGKVGIFEYAVILALSVFGVSKGAALSYGVLLHLVAYLPKIILGGFYLIKIKKV